MSLAERGGFEPPKSCPLPHFECGALDHYATSPLTIIPVDLRSPATVDSRVTRRRGLGGRRLGNTIDFMKTMADYEFIYETMAPITLETEEVAPGRVVTQTQLGSEALRMELAGWVRMIGFTRSKPRTFLRA